MHVVVTCYCFVVNDIYQWKTLQRSFIKKYQIPDQAKTDAETMRETMRQSRGSKVETEARPHEAEARPSQLKNCLEATSSRGRCLEDSVPGSK